MEFWLIQGNDKLHLPVPPANYAIKRAQNNSVIVVEGIGEVSFIGKAKLAEIPTIESFFPAQAYSWCQYSNFPTPKECTDLIEKWMASGNPIRYLVTETSINTECTIEDIQYGEQDGTGDVYFSLDLKEYKRIILTIAPVSAAQTGQQGTVTTLAAPSGVQRVVTKVTPKTYTVIKGDTLYAIAKRLTGNGTNYKAIAAKNNIKNVNLIYPGQVLQI